MMEYFSKNYSDARGKFLNATKQLNVESIKIKKGLHIDIATTNYKKDNLIILISGTHGVETYLGSAAQILFIKEYLPNLKNTDVCIIHSLNPYGFKHDRRVNENNVDLNRNTIYDERIQLNIPNTTFANMWADSLLFLKLNKPRKHRIIEKINYYVTLFKIIKKEGIKNTLNMGSQGQNMHPKSVNYRGIQLEDEILHLRNLIEQKTKGYKNAILIDIHSGLGRKYELTGATNQEPTTKEYKKLNKLIKKLKSRKTKKTKKYKGSISDLFLARSRAKKNTDLTLEYGTIPLMHPNFVLNHLAKLNLAENQIFNFGNEKQKQKMKKKYKKAYSPQDKIFKKSLIRKTKKFYEKLIEEYDK